MWRHISDSVRGASHEQSGSPCQDHHAVRLVGDDGRTLVACVSDGAGSASHSHEGAQAACDTIAERARKYLLREGSLARLTRDDAVAWCNGARDAIAHLAEMAELSPRDYACTLSVVLAGPGHTAFFQIGDGAIVARRAGAGGVVFWPQSGEYANTTNFLTQDRFQEHLGFQLAPVAFDDVALFTDGIERLALGFDSQTPHMPFFDPLFNAVRNAPDLDGLSEQLRKFLTSPSVQDRNDDDKTVILAARADDR